MLETFVIRLEEIYVPVKFQKTLDPDKVETIAESVMEDGQQMPIHVRQDENRYVLVAGYHRLEALKALGEETIEALIVSARRR